MHAFFAILRVVQNSRAWRKALQSKMTCGHPCASTSACAMAVRRGSNLRQSTSSLFVQVPPRYMQTLEASHPPRRGREYTPTVDGGRFVERGSNGRGRRLRVARACVATPKAMDKYAKFTSMHSNGVFERMGPRKIGRLDLR